MLEHDQLQQLYRYCVSLTQHAHNAHDLLQTAVLKWVQKGQPGDAPEAYIRKIIRHQFIDDCRRQQCVAFDPIEDQSALTLSEDVLEKQFIDSELTAQLMDRLENAEREVLFLSAVVGMTASEIADEVGSSRGTVLSRIFRVKKKAQGIMQDIFPERCGRNR